MLQGRNVACLFAFVRSPGEYEIPVLPGLHDEPCELPRRVGKPNLERDVAIGQIEQRQGSAGLHDRQLAGTGFRSPGFARKLAERTNLAGCGIDQIDADPTGGKPAGQFVDRPHSRHCSATRRQPLATMRHIETMHEPTVVKREHERAKAVTREAAEELVVDAPLQPGR